MQRVLHILAQVWSVLLYPLFIPTYGMLFFCIAFSCERGMLPAIWWWVCIGSTFVITCFIPLTSILVLMRTKHIKNLYITDARERTTPYLYTLLCFGFWCVLLFRLHVPLAISLSAVGATGALLAVLLINFRWKISAHLSGFGGLIGGVMSYCLSAGTMPSVWLVVALLMAALLLMYARLYTEAHTSLQVVTGFLLGLLCTFLPNLIVYYAH